MRVVLLGAPGSGKGTQAEKISAKYRIPHVSTGDLLREALAAGTPLGLRAKAAMDAGQLVSDEIVLGIIRERLRAPDSRKGAVLDGFPRNIAQGQALDVMLHDLDQPLDCAVLLDVDFDVLMQRLAGRRSCEHCGATYNVYTNPPRLDDQCDRCGSPLRHRADDNEVTVNNRLKVYEAQTKPLIEFYRRQGRLETVDGVGAVDEIFARLLTVLEPVAKGRRKSVPIAAPIKASRRHKAATAAIQRLRNESVGDKPEAVKPATKKTQSKAQVTNKNAAGKGRPDTAKKSAKPKKPVALKKQAAKALRVKAQARRSAGKKRPRT